MAREVSGLIADLAAARDASDNQARTAALAKAFSGKGESGLEYDRALRVFVQLVDPMNLTGDFTANVDRPKKEKDLSLHLVLKRGAPTTSCSAWPERPKPASPNPRSSPISARPVHSVNSH
ncbi:MAG: hypothetical protein M0D55_07650 [Elusimicrobiota bacterium]|nr:MAG: hypothetical protein M0D55_07650 [Elusimicrobiota bacterium]